MFSFENHIITNEVIMKTDLSSFEIINSQILVNVVHHIFIHKIKFINRKGLVVVTYQELHIYLIIFMHILHFAISFYFFRLTCFLWLRTCDLTVVLNLFHGTNNPSSQRP